MGLLYSLSIDERKQISFNNALTKNGKAWLNRQKSNFSIMTIISFSKNKNLKSVLNLEIYKNMLAFFSTVLIM